MSSLRGRVGKHAWLKSRAGAPRSYRRVQGALVDQADSGHGFLADLARSVIERSQVADLSHLFRQVSMAGGNGHATSEFIGAELSEAADNTEIAAGIEAALQEPSLPVVISTRQMVLF